MHTDIYTYFTEPNGLSELLYSAETWVRIELRLETAGPVSVSTRQDVTPVLSGKGILLPTTGESVRFTVPKGDRVFIASEGLNRVTFIVEPVPWLHQILTAVEHGFGGLGRLLTQRRGSARPGAPSPLSRSEPCPPAPRLPKLRR